MKKFEAQTLQEAYEKAAKEFNCSLLALQSEVIQYPRRGLFGIGKRSAIIVAVYNPEIENNQDANTNSATKATVDESTPGYEDSRCDESVDDNFYNTSSLSQLAHDTNEKQQSGVLDKELSLLIENQLKELFSHSCFLIDVIEVDVVDKTALIFIDGEDAALLIGKEGYRYNALSYMIFNWLFSKYDLYVKLEIARFLTSQQEMIRHTLRPTVEAVYRDGKAKTRPFNGILAQIALEQLREEFPDKYVAIKTNREGERFVIVNEFLPKN
ncbi:MAG TPA: protein jag [Epsilonproteobacteria bacterium]|nr:protein jag [Campylobacterota bacterium]